MLKITIDINERVIATITATLRDDSALPERGTYDVTIKETRFNSGDPKLFPTESFVLADQDRSKGALALLKSILNERDIERELDVKGTYSRSLRFRKAVSQGYTVRGDGRIERLCEHGVGHPIGHIDQAKEAERAMFIHGCCGAGCCSAYTHFTQQGTQDV